MLVAVMQVRIAEQRLTFRALSPSCIGAFGHPAETTIATVGGAGSPLKVLFQIGKFLTADRPHADLIAGRQPITMGSAEVTAAKLAHCHRGLVAAGKPAPHLAGMCHRYPAIPIAPRARYCTRARGWRESVRTVVRICGTFGIDRVPGSVTQNDALTKGSETEIVTPSYEWYHRPPRHPIGSPGIR